MGRTLQIVWYANRDIFASVASTTTRVPPRREATSQLVPATGPATNAALLATCAQGEAGVSESVLTTTLYRDFVRTEI